MKRAFIIYYIIIAMAFVVAISKMEKPKNAEGKSLFDKRFELLESDNDSGFFRETSSIYADRHTGVVYIRIEKIRSKYENGFIFMPLYNKDGSLLTKDEYLRQRRKL